MSYFKSLINPTVSNDTLAKYLSRPSDISYVTPSFIVALTLVFFGFFENQSIQKIFEEKGLSRALVSIVCFLFSVVFLVLIHYREHILRSKVATLISEREQSSEYVIRSLPQIMFELAQCDPENSERFLEQLVIYDLREKAPICDIFCSVTNGRAFLAKYKEVFTEQYIYYKDQLNKPPSEEYWQKELRLLESSKTWKEIQRDNKNTDNQ